MKIIIFLLFPLLTYGQKICDSDTIVNKYDIIRLKQLSYDCQDEMENYIKTNSQLEDLVRIQEKRIKILEDMLINRERWNINKCPRLSKKSKKSRRV